jgi:hypothetical protein
MIQMPRWIEWLEKRFEWASIPNLGIFLVALQAMGFLLVSGKPEFVGQLVLDPAAVFSGQIWRVVTFLAIPMSDSFMVIFVLWFLYYVLSSLERAWGSFRLTLYFLIAWAGAVMSSLVLGIPVDTFILIESSFFFALATLIPEYEILLFFILPIKIKWIALFTAAIMLAVPLVFGTWSQRLYLLVACANYLLFFGPGFYRFMRMEMRRRRQN